MARSEFLDNTRSARNLAAHGISSNGNGVGADGRTATLHSDIWLTQAAVRGFDRDDFPELSKSLVSRLDQSVKAFRALASKVESDKPATTRQTAAGRRELENISRITESFLPSTDEIRRLESAMKSIHFPEEVLTWDFEFGHDSAGEPAVWILILVDDRLENSKAFTDPVGDLPLEILKSVSRTGLARWPYVRFRTASDHKMLQMVGP